MWQPLFPGSRLTTAESSMLRRNPPCLTADATLYLPTELPEISPDDVKQILDDPLSLSTANIHQMRTQNGDAVGRFPITETVQDTAGTVLYPLPVTAACRHPLQVTGQPAYFDNLAARMPNIYPDAVSAQMRWTTLRNHVQQWFSGTSIEVHVDSPSPVSSGQ